MELYLSHRNRYSCNIDLHRMTQMSNSKSHTLQPEVRDHDPRLALDGGVDGMLFYRLLAEEAQSHLKSGAKLMAEFGDGQAAAIVDLFSQAGWPSVTTANDLSHQPRIVIASAGH